MLRLIGSRISEEMIPNENVLFITTVGKFRVENDNTPLPGKHLHKPNLKKLARCIEKSITIQ